MSHRTHAHVQQGFHAPLGPQAHPRADPGVRTQMHPNTAGAIGHGGDRRCFAGFWLRGLALVLDLLLLLVFFVVLTLVEGGLYRAVIERTILDPSGETLAHIDRLFSTVRFLVMVFVPLLYFTVLEAWFRGTFGKRLFGMLVVKKGCGRISLLRSFGRNMGKAVSFSFCFIGILVVLFTARRQTLHDLATGTYVIKKRWEGWIAQGRQG